MAAPLQYDITLDRGLAFNDGLTFIGEDHTGYTYRSQVRVSPDATGTPILTLTVTRTYAGTATIAAHISAGRLSVDIKQQTNPATGAKYTDTDTVAVTILTLHHDATGMALTAVPATEEGANVTLAWDLLATPSGGDEYKAVYGAAILRGTVTQ